MIRAYRNIEKVEDVIYKRIVFERLGCKEIDYEGNVVVNYKRYNEVFS